MKKFAEGVQSFKYIIENNCYYVDKTAIINDLITSKNFVFLSRPRRFGKSLTCSVLKHLYSGDKELFKNTFIYDKWDWNKKHPIIHIDFTSIGYKDYGLQTALENKAKEIAHSYNLPLIDFKIGTLFVNLINALYDKFQAKSVIIIDEYDKPIIDNLELDKRQYAIANREIMMNFYQPLKACSDKVEFFFMTGVSKFTRAGIFSQLNNLTDITINEKYNNLVGYSETELRTNFIDPLHLCFERDNTRYPNKYKDFEDFMAEVKRWYNGYNWGGLDTLYNPTSIYLFLTNQMFNNYWFETGSPAFLFTLAKQSKELGIFKLDCSLTFIQSFELDKIFLKTILFQAGYLTIDKILNYEYVQLRFPNFEVENSYYTFIINSLGNEIVLENQNSVYNVLKHAFDDNNLNEVIYIANHIVSNATNLVYLKPSEILYNTVFHLIFSVFGYEIESQVNTDRGRMDAVIKTKTHIYIFELKINQSASIALSQINKKNYAAKFSLDKRNIVLVGVSVDKETYTIKEFEAQNLII